MLRPGSGPLFNSSLVFGGDGSVLGQPQRQQYPDSEVRRYVHHGRKFPLQVIQTPAGRLGVLVGSDSWYPENYRQLAQQSVDLIANPVFLSGKDTEYTLARQPPPGRDGRIATATWRSQRTDGLATTDPDRQQHHPKPERIPAWPVLGTRQ